MMGLSENWMPVQAVQVTLAASGTEPVGQLVHTPPTSTLPAGQGAHDVAPTPEVRPAPQSRQADRPALGVYLPGVHGPHDVVLTPYWPALHRVQVEAPAADTLPAWQDTHEEAPLDGAYVPAEQEVQFEAPALGAYKPGAHRGHTFWAGRALAEPMEHDVQIDPTS